MEYTDVPVEIIETFASDEVSELCLVFEPSSPTLEVASKGKGHVKKYWARSRFWTSHGVYP